MSDFPGTFTLAGQRFSIWSGNPAFSADSADGATFWAVNAKRASDKQLFFLVVRQDAAGALTLAYQSEPAPAGAGQGTLRASAGQLIASYFVEAGDGKPTRRVVVPGYVERAAPPGLPGLAPEPAVPLAPLTDADWPNGGKPYTSNSQLLDLLFAVRFNKFVARLVELAAALAQIQRVLKAAGLLR